MQEKQVLGNNCVFSVTIGNERNENEFIIHSQSEGRRICEVNNVWDSDALKLARIINKNRFGRESTEELLKLINKNCRHLDLMVIRHEFGGIEKIINVGE